MKTHNLILPDNLHKKITAFAKKSEKTFKQVILETIAGRDDIFTKKDAKELAVLAKPKAKGRGDVQKAA